MRPVSKRVCFVLVLTLVIAGVEPVCLVVAKTLRFIHDIAFIPQLFELEDHLDRIHEIADGRDTYLEIDDELGWRVKANGVHALYRANRQGIRRNIDHEDTAAEGKVRIAVLGGSVAHGDNVRNAFTFVARLQEMDSVYDVLNYGVSEYGPGQALLQYERSVRRDHPDIVMVTLTTRDIERVVSAFVPFRDEDTEVPLGKPRFIRRGNTLEHDPNPLVSEGAYRELHAGAIDEMNRIGARDWFYLRRYDDGARLPSAQLYRFIRREFIARDITLDGRYNSESEAFDILRRIVDRFYHAVLNDGALPVFVLCPDLEEIETWWDDGERISEPLLTYLNKHHYPHLDLQRAFDVYRRDIDDAEILMDDNLTPLAHDIAARYLVYYLEANGFTSPASVSAAVAAHTNAFLDNQLTDYVFVAGEVFEAEDGFLMNQRSPVLQAQDFSEAHVVTVPSEPGNVALENAKSIFIISVTRPSVYRLKARVLAADRERNSMYVKLGTAGFETWYLDANAEWTWQETPFSWALNPGRYTLVIAEREPVVMDKLSVVENNPSPPASDDEQSR